MTIRKLLLILFLYVLLVWILAAYLHSADVKELVNFGLLWTAIGVAVLLCGVLLERLYGWWHSRRAQPAQPAQPGTVSATSPASAPAGPVVLTEDDNTLLGLIRDADQRLAQAPGRAAAGSASVLDLPLILAVGPERSGKTAVIHHSGLEPALLAGQAIGNDGTVASTRVANLWLAHESLLLEVSGRIFAGDRLAEFLRNLRPKAATGWKAWFTPQRQPPQVRGVLLFFDAREFMGTPEPSRLDRWAQAIRTRLSTTAAAFFGAECPVYVLFTNTDALPYFEDFFNGMAETEVGQVLGLIAETSDAPAQGRVWAEAETKRLNQLFQTLFLRLSDRRLIALSQETDPSRRPSTYEFPREFRRIRAPLVQFLVDVFKPDPLNPGGRLRGIFFTGTRKGEQTAAPAGMVTQAYQSRPVAPDATSIFAAGGATQVFRAKPKGTSGRLVERWIFATEFFQKVLSLDQPLIKPIPQASKFGERTKLAAAVAAALAGFLALLWTISWAGNWGMVSDVGEAVRQVQTGNADLSARYLQKLDNLRVQLEQLQQGHPWLHWGLFQGENLRETAARVYFGRLKLVSLDGIDQTLGRELRLAGSPGQQEDTGTTYDRLKTYRTIAARACPVDQPLVGRVLTDTIPQAHPGLGAEQRAKLETQLNFYVAQLAANKNLPLSLQEDSSSVEKARVSIRAQNGDDQRLRGLLSEIGGQVKALTVPPEYRAVLKGQTDFRGEFTKQGQLVFEDRVAHDNFGSEERCVMGESAGQQVLQQLDTGTRDRLRSLYYRWYANAWRDFPQFVQRDSL